MFQAPRTAASTLSRGGGKGFSSSEKRKAINCNRDAPNIRDALRFYFGSLFLTRSPLCKSAAKCHLFSFYIHYYQSFFRGACTLPYAVTPFFRLIPHHLRALRTRTQQPECVACGVVRCVCDRSPCYGTSAAHWEKLQAPCPPDTIVR
jgi:hypothetical protein